MKRLQVEVTVGVMGKCSSDEAIILDRNAASHLAKIGHRLTGHHITITSKNRSTARKSLGISAVAYFPPGAAPAEGERTSAKVFCGSPGS